MHPNLPQPVVSQSVYQQRRVEETNVQQVTATVTPEELAMIQRQRDLRRIGLIELAPGKFQRINVPPKTRPQPPPVETAPPAYVQPPLPAYAPGFIPSPVRPGFEGMPSVLDFGSEYLDELFI